MRAMTRLTAGITALAVAGAAAAAARRQRKRVKTKVHRVVPHKHKTSAQPGGNRPGPQTDPDHPDRVELLSGCCLHARDIAVVTS